MSRLRAVARGERVEILGGLDEVKVAELGYELVQISKAYGERSREHDVAVDALSGELGHAITPTEAVQLAMALCYAASTAHRTAAINADRAAESVRRDAEKAGIRL